ncbi:MAG: hypothetical protein V8R82_10505 [Clostridia bacterium]
MDGRVYIRNTNIDKPDNIINQFKKCKVIDVSNYDLIARFK